MTPPLTPRAQRLIERVASGETGSVKELCEYVGELEGEPPTREEAVDAICAWFHEEFAETLRWWDERTPEFREDVRSRFEIYFRRLLFSHARPTP